MSDSANHRATERIEEVDIDLSTIQAYNPGDTLMLALIQSNLAIARAIQEQTTVLNQARGDYPR